MNNEILDMLIQAGAVGIAILVIVYSAWKDKMYNKTMNNHLNHFTTAIENNNKIIGASGEIMRNTAKTMERVVDCLDKR